MYTAFYGLGEKPFSLTPNPRFLFLSESHREALAHLLYGIDQGEGFIAITGEVGTGKTTICRTLIERLGAETEVAFLFNPSRTARELLQAIATEFGLDPARRSRSDLLDELNRFLLEKKREGKRVLLIIDESQNLSDETLEQVRLLSNLETPSSKLIQILLLGQPELDRKLDSAELRQLRQRISVRWRLAPLTSRETRAYVAHRLRVAAGAQREVFTRSAMREIDRRTGGVPRLINVLCDRVLLAGYAAQAHRIDAGLVRKVAREIPDTRVAVGARRKGEARGRRRWLAAAAVVFVAALGGAASFAVLEGRVPLFDRIATGGVGPTLPTVASGPERVTQQKALEEADTASEGIEPVGMAAEEPPPVSARPPAGVEAAADWVLAPPVLVPPRVAPSALTPPALASPEPEAVFEVEVAGLAGEPLAAPDPSFLGWALAKHSPGEVRSRAVASILDAYGLGGLEAAAADDDEALSALRRQGLRVLILEEAELEDLRALNHPVLLSLAADDGLARVVALSRLEMDVASIVGPLEGEALAVHVVELEDRWTGRAWVLWRQFEPAPDVISFGDQGLAVIWLQTALAELGYYTAEPSGIFDPSTLDGVRALQESRQLEPDGAAGPRTQMLIYDLLGRYAVPRLNEQGASG